MNIATSIANTLWGLSSAPAYASFYKQSSDLEQVQRRKLGTYLTLNKNTSYGRDYEFSALQSWEEYAVRVPLTTYEDYQPYIDLIAKGEMGVLTHDKVQLFEPTSGSTSASKWIPYTTILQSEFRRAVSVWIADVFKQHPPLIFGPAYWSLTPSFDQGGEVESVIPAGFDEDGAYLGKLSQKIIDLTLISHPSLRFIKDMEKFWFVTLLLLLRASDLRLLSVWHPSFVFLLLKHMKENWSSILRAMHEGFAIPELGIDLPANPERALFLKGLRPDDMSLIWPKLGLISCWGDGAAYGQLEELRTMFPGVCIQPKGLIATEAFVSIPVRGQHLLAYQSHFFEFKDVDGNIFPAWRLELGAEYSVIVTTGGGLYRYQLKDRIQVDGFYNSVPSIKFLGKEDGVIDHCGEKLSEHFVTSLLKETFLALQISPCFCMLAFEAGAASGYKLFLELERGDQSIIRDAVERALCENPHYAYCLKLGQLAPLEVVHVRDNAYDIYSQHLMSKGMRLGDIKPVALSPHTGWVRVFGSSVCNQEPFSEEAAR